MRKLTVEQTALVAQFADYSFDYQRLSLNAMAKNVGVR
jgi:hypothetical protein